MSDLAARLYASIRAARPLEHVPHRCALDDLRWGRCLLGLNGPARTSSWAVLDEEARRVVVTVPLAMART